MYPNHSSYILLADDDKDDRFLFREALREVRNDIHLLTAEHGKALMEMLFHATILPDLILLDINMPFKNGKECLIEIKNDRILSEIPVIMYSTSSNPRDIEDTYRAGANLYIEKPFSFSGLTELLGKVLMLDWSQYIPRPDRSLFVYQTEKPRR